MSSFKDLLNESGIAATSTPSEQEESTQDQNQQEQKQKVPSVSKEITQTLKETPASQLNENAQPASNQESSTKEDNSQKEKSSDANEEEESVVILPSDRLMPNFLNGDYFWLFEEGAPVIYRKTKDGQTVKFERRGKHFVWMHPALLEANDIQVNSIQYVERGQVLLTGVTPQGSTYVIFDDFTSQMNGKLAILTNEKPIVIVFRHNKKAIIEAIEMIKAN